MARVTSIGLPHRSRVRRTDAWSRAGLRVDERQPVMRHFAVPSHVVLVCRNDKFHSDNVRTLPGPRDELLQGRLVVPRHPPGPGMLC